MPSSSLRTRMRIRACVGLVATIVVAAFVGVGAQPALASASGCTLAPG